MIHRAPAAGGAEVFFRGIGAKQPYHVEMAISGAVSTDVLRIALVAGWLLVPRAALAYRPFDGTDADLAEPDTIELEVGPLQAERVHGDTSYAPGGVFNYGVADGYEVVVDLDGVVPLGDAPGASAVDSDVLVKHLFREGSLQDKRGPSIALETGVLLPGVPTPTTGVDDAGWIADLIVSQRWSRITIHANATGFYGRDRNLGGFASLIVEGPSAAHVRPVCELLAEREGDGTRFGSVLAGVIWQHGKDFSLDAAAVGARETGTGTTTVQVRLGFTWAFAI